MEARQPTPPSFREVRVTATQTIDGHRCTKRPRLHDKTWDETAPGSQAKSRLLFENKACAKDANFGVEGNSVEGNGVDRNPPHLSFIAPPYEASQDGGWVESCYGMLCGILVRSKSTPPAPNTYNGDHPVSFQPPNKLSSLGNGTLEFEIQSATCARVLKELHDLEEISMQLFCYSRLEISRQTLSPLNKIRKEKRRYTWHLNVIIYGTPALEDVIGQHLSKNRMYLQDPVDCARNVVYRNPHMTTHGGSIVMTESFASTQNQVEIEQLSLGPALLAQLMEAQTPLEETEPSPIVTTKLFCHQKQALTFMIRREQGWDLGGNLDIWTERIQPGQNVRYRNNVNGACQNEPPPVFRGGLMADDMGLGKTLNMISLIVTVEFPVTDLSHPRTYIDRDATSSYNNSTLVVVPPPLINAWKAQFAAHVRPGIIDLYVFHGQKRQAIKSCAQHSVIITTYQTLSSIWRKVMHETLSDPIFSTIWRRVILDEAHTIQNADSQLAQACCALQAERRWAITGTPIQNKLTDFASIIKFLRVYPYCQASAFEDEISRPWRQSNPEGFLRLKTLVRAITISRTKSVIELPTRSDEIHHVEFSPAERDAYDCANKDTIELFEEVISSGREGSKTFNALSRLNHLRKFCNLGLLAPVLEIPKASRRLRHSSRPAYDREAFLGSILDGSITCPQCEEPLLGDFLEGGSTPHFEALPCDRQLIQVCNKCKPDSSPDPTLDFAESSTTDSRSVSYADDVRTVTTELLPTKLKTLVTDLTKNCRDEKCVVFSFWTSTLDVVQSMLERNGITYTRVDGKTSLERRSEAILSFQTNDSTRVILVSITCGGAGVDLTAGSRAYLLEPHWNPMIEEQALCRIHRVGQKRNVTTIRYIMRKSFEEQVVEIQKRKKKLAEITFGSGQISEGGIGMGTLQYLKSVLE